MGKPFYTTGLFIREAFLHKMLFCTNALVLPVALIKAFMIYRAMAYPVAAAVIS